MRPARAAAAAPEKSGRNTRLPASPPWRTPSGHVRSRDLAAPASPATHCEFFPPACHERQVLEVGVQAVCQGSEGARSRRHQPWCGFEAARGLARCRQRRRPLWRPELPDPIRFRTRAPPAGGAAVAATHHGCQPTRPGGIGTGSVAPPTVTAHRPGVEGGDRPRPTTPLAPRHDGLYGAERGPRTCPKNSRRTTIAKSRFATGCSPAPARTFPALATEKCASSRGRIR